MYWIYFFSGVFGVVLIKMTPEIAKENEGKPDRIQISQQAVNVLVSIGWLLIIVSCVLLLIHAAE